MKSWLDIPRGSHFSLANIPFGIITHSGNDKRKPAVAIGDYALDLDIFTANSGFRDLSIIQPHSHVFSEPTLNAFTALGRPIHVVVRKYLQSVFLADTPYPEVLKDNRETQKACLIPRSEVTMCLPFKIGGYTDFFVGMNHAFNAGSLFRGRENALNINYRHLPVAYHSRASSVVVSGTPIHRPCGQLLETPNAKTPVWAPCKNLDFELELGAFVAKENAMGEPIDVNDAADSIFGFVLLNDWSARDIQAWEYQPLGPFTAKNFGTSISPWVVLADALESFRTKGIQTEVELLPYLKESQPENVYDIKLEVDLTTSSHHTTTICRTSAKNLLFSFPQMLAHHTVTGCPMEIGDLVGSGTISGTEPGSLGCLLEQTKAGREQVALTNGGMRSYLEDGDTVTFRGYCGDDSEALVGFGECTGVVLPAVEMKK